MRQILYITGSRADYGPARSVLRAIRTEQDLSLSLIVTAMHLDPVHGETWREIERDGFEIAERITGRVPGDSLGAMAASIGQYLYGMSQAITRLQPDVLLVLGDRGEQLAAAIAAALQNVVVVHLCGGSLSGSIDDSIRHAITKFSHYHLPSFEEHAQRIIQMGEDPETVEVVGLPGGDISGDVTVFRESICAQYGLPLESPYLLVVQHPVTQSQAAAAAQVTETLEAVLATGHHALLANPNDDAGGRAILETMERYAQTQPRLKILPPPASRERFASVMAHSAALVGNSSSAVGEAMSVALPVVNIGDRQRGREHLACWINVPVFERTAIAGGIMKAVEDTAYRSRLQEFAAHLKKYSTEQLVVDCLRRIDLSLAKRGKKFCDAGAPIAVENSKS